MRDQPASEPGTSGPGVPRTGHDNLLLALAETVLAVPGVVRLEPTLTTSGPGVLLRRSPTDGIRLLTRADSADVDINIATTAACPARAVTHHVQANVTRLLHERGYTPGPIAVSVLAIDAP